MATNPLPPSSSVCANGAMQKTAHRHRFAPTARCEKNRRRAVVYVIPRLANNLYNRSSAVDFLLIQPTPGRQANLGLRLYNRPSAVASPIKKNPPSSSVCTNGAMRKTAEERFHTLARGWLAYPVTPMHAQLPLKSGCICHPPALQIYTTALRR